MKRAFVTGYTGQDATFLTKFLLEKGYEVVGLIRRISTEPPVRVRGKYDFSDYIKTSQLILESGDLGSLISLLNISKKYKFDEVYNLAAQSDVGISFEQPEYTFQVNYFGLVNLMYALDQFNPDAKLYQASTSEMFGDRKDYIAITEETPFDPNSPYAISKTAAHYEIKRRRRAGKFAVGGILFNHESEIRGGNFVTQKIAHAVARQAVNADFVLNLGNLEARRDWGYAEDYIKAMWLMLQQDKPEDFVIGTGNTHSVREFVETALKIIGKKIKWIKADNQEVGFVNDYAFVVTLPELQRPTDVNYLVADASRAKKVFGWESTVSFEDLVRIMVTYQLE